jgi:hypothetical protein
VIPAHKKKDGYGCPVTEIEGMKIKEARIGTSFIHIEHDRIITK